MTDINPLVVDLSHWDPADDYTDVVRDGIVGVIYKGTEGTSYTDPTYVQQQQSAKAAGLKWGAYHFATAASLQGQIDNFLRYVSPDPDELFCLDWEDYGSNTMSLSSVKTWITEVENALHRPRECVLYSGNTAKEALGSHVDTFLGERRLWLCQYGSNPTWNQSWDRYWLWQYTDGVVGPQPHTINGIGPCDINSYDHGVEQLVAEWASGRTEQPPTAPAAPAAGIVNVLISAPVGVEVKVRILGQGTDETAEVLRRLREREGR